MGARVPAGWAIEAVQAMRVDAMSAARATVGLTSDDHEQMTRYMPPSGPALKKWTRLHTLHVLAMQQQNYYEACKIADAKFQIYLADSRERTAAWIAEHVG